MVLVVAGFVFTAANYFYAVDGLVPGVILSCPFGNMVLVFERGEIDELLVDEIGAERFQY